MSELKLLPCPFCGGRASQPASTSPSDERCGYNFVAYVECSACGVSTRTESNHDKGGWCNESIESAKARAVKKWNSRTQPEATAPAQDLSAAIPDGWQLVPIEPTRAMWDAESKVDNDAYAGGNHHGASSEQIWHAMLGAAPQPPANALVAGDREKYLRERNKALEAIVRSTANDLVRINAALGLPDGDPVDADEILEKIAAIQAQKDGHG